MLPYESIAVASSLARIHCQACAKNIPIRVYNARDTPYKLRRNTMVATLTEIDRVFDVADEKARKRPHQKQRKILKLKQRSSSRAPRGKEPHEVASKAELVCMLAESTRVTETGNGGLPGEGPGKMTNNAPATVPSHSERDAHDCLFSLAVPNDDLLARVTTRAGRKAMGNHKVGDTEAWVATSSRGRSDKRLPEAESSGEQANDPSSQPVQGLLSKATQENLSKNACVPPPSDDAERARLVKIAETVGEHGMPAYLEKLYKQSIVHVPDMDKKQIKEFLLRNKQAFARGSWDLGSVGQEMSHMIRLKTDMPVKHRQRRLSPTQTAECKSIIADMKKARVIRESNSEFASPIVLVKKKNGSTRLCVDYRALNDMTIKHSYPLPRIDALLDDLGSKKWFATLDLQSGYWQVPIAEADKYKTAFVAAGGLYEFNVIPFGLTNAPAAFQKVMNNVMKNLPQDIAMCYLDDIIVSADTVEALIKNLDAVLGQFQKIGLKFGPNKCQFFQKEVTFLGHRVSAEGIRMEPEKLIGISKFKIPENRKQVQSFLGACNYYRRFVKNFSAIAVPLSALCSPNVKFRWTQREQGAFETLKNALVEAPMLAFPHQTAQFILDTDASDYGVGAVLSQVVEENNELVERPISYYSKTLDKYAKNYCITRKELLAAILGIQHHKAYLWGRHFILRSDHGALKFMMTKTSEITDPVVVRMLEVAAPYSIQHVYRKGELHANADACSRGTPCTVTCRFCTKNIHCCKTCDQVNGDFEDDCFNPTYKTREQLLTKTTRDVLSRVDPEFLEKIKTQPGFLSRATAEWLRKNDHKLSKNEKDVAGIAALRVMERVIDNDAQTLQKHWEKQTLDHWRLSTRGR